VLAVTDLELAYRSAFIAGAVLVVLGTFLQARAEIRQFKALFGAVRWMRSFARALVLVSFRPDPLKLAYAAAKISAAPSPVTAENAKDIGSQLARACTWSLLVLGALLILGGSCLDLALVA
jgi:hypothetical protein